MSDNSRKITVGVNLDEARQELENFRKEIAKKVNISVGLSGSVGGGGSAPAGAPAVAMGGQPITGAAGYTVSAGTIPGVPDGLKGAALSSATHMGYKAAVTASLEALKQAGSSQASAEKQQAAKMAADAAKDLERAKAERVAAQLTGQEKLADVRAQLNEKAARARATIQLETFETKRAAKKEDKAEAAEEAEKKRAARAEQSTAYGAQLVAFERARMLAQGIPDLIRPMMGTQLSGFAHSASQGIGMYSQWSASGQRHAIRAARRGGGGMGGGAGGGDGAEGEGATSAVSSAAGAAATAVGGPLAGIITRAVAQAALSMAGMAQDIAQQASNKMMGLQLQRATIQTMSGSRSTSFGTKYDPVGGVAARMGISVDDQMGADAGLARSSGSLSPYLRTYLPSTLASGQSPDALFGLGHALSRRSGTNEQASRAAAAAMGTISRFGLTGAAADESLSATTQAIATQNAQGKMFSDPVEIPRLMQNLGGTIGTSRAGAVVNTYAGMQNSHLGGIKEALRQYGDAKQLAKAMKGARSLGELLANADNQSISEKMASDAEGELGPSVMHSRGLGFLEAQRASKTKLNAPAQDMDVEARNRMFLEQEDRKAAAYGTVSERDQMTAVDENTKLIARSQVNFIQALTNMGDALNATAAKLSALTPWGPR